MGNKTVIDVSDAVCKIEDAAVMRDHQNGTIRADGDFAQEVHDVMAGFGVEGRSGFVTDDEFGVVD